MDPLLPTLVAAAFAILLVGALLRRLRQPHVVGYLVAGVVLGPYGLALFTDEVTVTRLGEVGVVLLLFFVGMEVSLPRLASGWRVSLVGTLLQVLASVGAAAFVGTWVDWPLSKVVLVGFAISLSSTAVVVSLLRSLDQMDTDSGRDALGILLVQDVMVVPMLIVVGLLGGEQPSTGQLVRQGLGGLLCVVAMWRLARSGRLRVPFAGALRRDPELRVFAAFGVCFGVAMLSALLGLSTALGAFVAGVVVAAARETDWVHTSLDPLRVLFVALFFVSIGMLIDLDFLRANWQLVALLVGATLVGNTAINAGVLRWLGRPWSTSLFLGALLAQAGEFGFVLAAVGRQLGIVADFGYQVILCVISVTLVLSPAWIHLARVILHPESIPRPRAAGRPDGAA